MNDQKQKQVNETRNSVERMQSFDPESIARTEELGRTLNFSEAVPDARRIIELFKQISLDVLPEFSTQRLTTLKQTADAEFNRFQNILKFSAGEGNPKQNRDQLISQLQQGYDQVFENIWPAIAYSVRQATDFARLEREARAAIQSIDDRTHEIETDLHRRSKEAEGALDAIRKVAAEQGVSQQAIYFRQESDEHGKQAKTWLYATAGICIFAVVCAFGSLFIHKIPVLAPTDTYQGIQLGISKVLIFGGIGYFLLLSGRNFMAHRHNAVVNKHRQNSLVTFRALVEAAGEQVNRDILVTKAAETVFGAQPTGFSKIEGDEGKALSMLNVSPSSFKGSSSP